MIISLQKSTVNVWRNREHTSISSRVLDDEPTESVAGIAANSSKCDACSAVSPWSTGAECDSARVKCVRLNFNNIKISVQ